MATADRFWLLLPPQLRNLPADLAATLFYLAVTLLTILVPGLNETPLRVLFGLPLVLFVPGYVFIAALFPEAGSSSHSTPPAENHDTTEQHGIDGIERIALSFGLSIAIVPLIGLVLNFTPWGIRLEPILLSLSLFVIGATAIATQRRWALPAEERFAVPYQQWIVAGRTELLEPETRTDLALNVLLVVSVLLAAGSVAYAVSVPKQGEAFTELYLLSETENGDLVADDYPTEFVIGENKSVTVGVGNHEHQPVQYTVVTELQRVRIQNNSTVVLGEDELRRFRTPELAANETWHHTHSITPTMTGTRLRLTYLLYRDTVPANPTVNNAYRENHLFINVSSTAGE